MCRKLVGVLVVVIAWSTAAWAEDVPVVLKGVSRGKDYHLQVDLSGEVRIVPLKVATVGEVPNPPLPPPPPPPAPTQLSAAVEQLTNVALVGGGTKTTGAAIAAIYSLAAKEVAEDRLDPLKAFDFTASATTTVLGFQPDGAKWATFRADLSKLITPQPQTTKDEVSSLMKQIAAGMDKATGFNSSPASLDVILAATPQQRAMMGILDNINIEKIIELIKLIMTLLALFKGGM